MIQEISAEAFIDSIGVNTQFGVPGSPFANPAIRQLLSDSRIRHIRDDLLPINRVICAQAAQLKLIDPTLGVCFVLPPDYAPSMLSHAMWLGLNIEAFEAPNELNLSGTPYWYAKAAHDTRTLFYAAK